MTKDELKKLDEDLAKEQKLIESQLKRIASENPLVRGDFDVRVEDIGSSMEDASQELGELDRNQAMVDELERKLKEIKVTREKIKADAYGKCESCAETISEARLRVVPVASLCMQCAKIHR